MEYLRSFPFGNGSRCVERRSPVAHAKPFRDPFPSHRGFRSESFRDSRLRLVPFGPLLQFPLLPPRLAQHSADEPFRLLLFRFPDFGALVPPRPPLPDPIQQFFPERSLAPNTTHAATSSNRRFLWPAPKRVKGVGSD